MTNAIPTDPTKLNDLMQFDHVIEVDKYGIVHIGPKGIYAPTLYDGVLDDNDHWEMLNGYSGQDSYPGPIMHNSEYIGGAMALDILNEPGIYVAVVSLWTQDDDDDDDFAEGWAVARYREV